MNSKYFETGIFFQVFPRCSLENYYLRVDAWMHKERHCCAEDQQQMCPRNWAGELISINRVPIRVYMFFSCTRKKKD